MRLIDRDALNEMLSALLEKIGGENITWDDAMATIDHADDVDAIPIQWIEKWFSQFYGEQGLEWNRCKRFMLEDWEKEK